jgi:hypothetical protein
VGEFVPFGVGDPLRQGRQQRGEAQCFQELLQL